MPDVARLQNFLDRNGYPHHLVDPATDEDAASFVAASPTCLRNLPWVVLADGTTLRNPAETELARAIGMNARRSATVVYDVAIVGAGPAGLATAVYAASEGLSVAVLDSRAYGGQAGASARIENYLGFPTGISGGALTGRAFVQAQKFGADMMIPTAVLSLDCSLDDGFFAHHDRRRRAHQGALRGDRQRRPLPASADRGTRPLRGQGRLVLGLAGRGQADAPARRSSWSAAAIRPARRRSTSPALRPRSTC